MEEYVYNADSISRELNDVFLWAGRYSIDNNDTMYVCICMYMYVCVYVYMYVYVCNSQYEDRS